MTMTSLNERLRRVLRDSGLSLPQFAARIGVARTTVARYRDSQVSPPLDFLEKVCEQFQVNRRWLILGETEAKEATDTLHGKDLTDLTKVKAYTGGYAEGFSAGVSKTIAKIEEMSTELAAGAAKTIALANESFSELKAGAAKTIALANESFSEFATEYSETFAKIDKSRPEVKRDSDG